MFKMMFSYRESTSEEQNHTLIFSLTNSTVTQSLQTILDAYFSFNVLNIQIHRVLIILRKFVCVILRHFKILTFSNL